MSAVLVDTDVFSFFLKLDSRRALYAQDIAGRDLCISMMTFAELHRWSLERGWGAGKMAILESALKHYLILDLDETAARTWAEVVVHRKRIGRPIECGDCWIAATALRHGLPLLTHNGKHYADIPGLHVVSHTR